MEQELVTKIETADIPAELKHALTDLGQNLDALLPVVPIPLKRRVLAKNLVRSRFSDSGWLTRPAGNHGVTHSTLETR